MFVGMGVPLNALQTVQGWSHLATPSPGHHVTSCKPCCRRLPLKWKSLNPHGLARSVCKLRFPSPKHGNLGLQFPKKHRFAQPNRKIYLGKQKWRITAKEKVVHGNDAILVAR